MDRTWLQSLTIRGVVVIALGSLITQFGLPFDAEWATDQAFNVIGGLMDVVGILMTVRGRVRAAQPLTKVL